MLDGEYIWKYTHQAYDFSVLGNTPITFPIEWDRSKIPGYAIRGSMPNFHGLSAFIVMSSVAARFFEPQVSGIGADARRQRGVPHRPRRKLQPDHAPAIPAVEERAVARLQLALRQRPGGRSGAVRGRQLRQRAERRRDSIVDVSGLTPDQQFQAGLYCGSVLRHSHHCRSARPDCARHRSTGPTYVYDSGAPAPRTTTTIRRASRRAVCSTCRIGDDNLFHGEKHKWSLRLTVVNLTNKDALYNFLSTFSGTHYVTPRAMTATIGFHF